MKVTCARGSKRTDAVQKAASKLLHILNGMCLSARCGRYDKGKGS